MEFLRTRKLADIFVVLKYKMRVKIYWSYQERRQKYQMPTTHYITERTSLKIYEANKSFEIQNLFQRPHIDFKIFSNIGYLNTFAEW